MCVLNCVCSFRTNGKKLFWHSTSLSEFDYIFPKNASIRQCTTKIKMRAACGINFACIFVAQHAKGVQLPSYSPSITAFVRHGRRQESTLSPTATTFVLKSEPHAIDLASDETIDGDSDERRSLGVLFSRKRRSTPWPLVPVAFMRFVSSRN